MTFTRLVTLDDAAEIAEVLTENRGFLAEWEPLHSDNYFTVEWQATLLERALRGYADGSGVPLAILAPDGRIAGRRNRHSGERGVHVTTDTSHEPRRPITNRSASRVRRHE